MVAATSGRTKSTIHAKQRQLRITGVAEFTALPTAAAVNIDTHKQRQEVTSHITTDASTDMI